MKLSYMFLGFVRVAAKDENISSLLNLCMYYCIPYSNINNADDGATSFDFYWSDAKKLLNECGKRGIEVEVIKKSGLPVFFNRYRYRHGLLAGFICAVIMIYMSGRFVWDVRVEGNENLSVAQVKEILRTHGLDIGTYIPSVNIDRLQNGLLMESEQISWISVNIMGNVANVQIREKKSVRENESTTKFANLVAKKSGIIEQVQVYRGNIMVRAGDYVNEGGLLVSGLYDSERTGFRYTRASGSVMARTVSEYTVEIPFEYEEKEYTGRVNYEKTLNFFGYSLNILKKCRNDIQFYDTINKVDNCSFPDGTKTPLEISTVSYHEYKYVKKNRTLTEAQNLAYFNLSQLIEQNGDAMIIRKTVTSEQDDNCFRLRCILVCIEDIARVSEFEVDLSE